MKALSCEMCGSTNLIKEGGVFVCQSCGTKYSVEEAKKMMVEGTVNVKIDNSEELENLYELAHRAKDSDNSENALKYYDMILMKDASSWEANYYILYYKALGCTTANEISSAATSLVKTQEFVVKQIKEKVSDKEQQKAALEEIMTKNMSISPMLLSAYYTYISEYNATGEDGLNELEKTIYSVIQISCSFGDEVDSAFNGEFSDISVQSWKSGLSNYKVEENKTILMLKRDKNRSSSLFNSYGDKIRKYDSSYTNPDIKFSYCYVATAVYGSYDCPEVWTLRRYRDYTLDETWYGRLFIKVYYATSPSFVKHFGNANLFKSLGKKLLDKFVAKLNNKGYDNSPYNDRY